MEWRTDEEAGDLFYSTYAEACRERDQVPLPASFVRGERSRNPQSCSFALVHRGDELAGAWMTVLDRGVLKVVEGASVHRHRDAQVAAWMVSRFIKRAESEGQVSWILG